MHDTPAIGKTYRGTLKEVRSHLNEIPDTSEVEVNVLDLPSDGEERARLRKVIDHFLKEIGHLAEKERRPVDEIGEELIRQAQFPEIEFRNFGLRRLACVKGRIEVWQVIMIAREYGDDIQGIADHLVLRPEQARAALDYYAAYPDEINAMLAENDSMTYEKMKQLYPWMKIGLKEITDEDFARLEREYPLEELKL